MTEATITDEQPVDTLDKCVTDSMRLLALWEEVKELLRQTPKSAARTSVRNYVDGIDNYIGRMTTERLRSIALRKQETEPDAQAA